VSLQSVEFDVWFGTGVLALLWACLQIWHTGRALNRVRRDLGAQQGRSRSAAVAELAGSVAR
jgi:hypothetical protein